MRQFNSKFGITCAVFAALAGGVFCAPAAQAQPEKSPNSGNVIVVTKGENGPLVNVSAESIAVSTLIEQLTKQTRLDYILYADADIAFIEIVNLLPAEALKKIAEAADLSIYAEGETYILDKKLEVVAGQEQPIDLSFRDISIRNLLITLKEQFDVKIEIAPAVTGDLIAINLTNETPTGAVKKIARGARLSLNLTKDGVYRVGFDNETPAN